MTPGCQDEFALGTTGAKVCALILCTMMLVRHYQFYFPFQSIINEMGYLQSIWGILLIPVTASFGFFAHMRQGKLVFDAWATGRLILLGLIPVVLAIFDGNVSQILSYTYTDPSARPRLLILLPIAISVLLRLLLFRDSVTIAVFILLGTFFIYEITSSFVAHYVAIFLCVGLFFQYGKKLAIPPMPLAIFVYLGMTAILLLAQLERVSVWHELVWTASFVTLAVWVSKMSVLRGFSVMFPPILYFYLCQAIIFNIAALFLRPGGFLSAVVVLLIVYSSTFYAAKILEFFEEKAKKIFLEFISLSSHS